MNTVGRILKRLTEMVFGNRRLGWLRFQNSNRNYDTSVDLLSANVVMAPVLWLARTFPEAPLAISRDGELDFDHAMLRLINRPNSYYSGLLLFMATMISYAIDGNAYWIIVRNRQNRPVELWYVPHFMISPVSDSDMTFVEYYRYTPGGREIKLDVEDVVHFRYGIDPKNPRQGLSPVKVATREIFTDEEASNFSASVLTNSGMPGIVITPEGDTTIPAQDVDAMKRYVKDRFSGDFRGDPLVVGAPTRVEQFGWDPEKLNLSRLRAIPEERVTALLGIPAAVVGFGTGLEQTTVGATMRELRELAYEGCIIPTQRLIADELQTQLLPEFEPRPSAAGVVFDLSHVRVLQEDENALAERVQSLVTNGIFTRAQALRELGYETTPSDEVYLMRMGTIEIPAGRKRRLLPSPGSTTKASKADISELGRTISRALYDDERELTASYKGELTQRLNDYGQIAERLFLAEALAKAGGNGVGRKALEDEMLSFALTPQIVQEVTKPELLDYKGHYLRVARRTLETIDGIVELRLGMVDSYETSVVEEGGRRLGLVDLDGQTREALFSALTDAREDGEGIYETARRVRQYVSAGPWRSAEYRAEIISRTETKFAQNKSSLEAYRASDTVQAIEVLDSQRGSFDDYCDSVNGRIVSYSQADYLLREEHPNGTRSFAPVIAEGFGEVDYDELPRDVAPNTGGA